MKVTGGHQWFGAGWQGGSPVLRRVAVVAVSLLWAVLVGVARADTVENRALQWRVSEESEVVASVSDNHATREKPRTVEWNGNAERIPSAQSAVAIASFRDMSVSPSSCLSCDKTSGLRGEEARRALPFLGAEKATLTIDEGIAGGDACAQTETADDCRNNLTREIVKKDWSGIGRDTAYFVGYQLAVIGFLYVLPEDVTGWTKEKKRSYDFDEWVKNVKNPVWDEDKFYLNWLVHPYWGAAYYIRARERGFDKLESFVYSAFLSSLFEFGAEALFEPPSYQDLIFTPVGGTLLGMYVFEPIRERIKAKGDEQTWYEALALVLSDPLGAVSELTDKLLGIKSTARITNSSAKAQLCRHEDRVKSARASACRGAYTGLEVTVRW